MYVYLNLFMFKVILFCTLESLIINYEGLFNLDIFFDYLCLLCTLFLVFAITVVMLSTILPVTNLTKILWRGVVYRKSKTNFYEYDFYIYCCWQNFMFSHHIDWKCQNKKNKFKYQVIILSFIFLLILLKINTFGIIKSTSLK